MNSTNSQRKPTEIVVVADRDDQARCDGGLGALGHPMVYLPFDAGDVVDCYYCSRRFVRERLADACREQQISLDSPLETLASVTLEA